MARPIRRRIGCKLTYRQKIIAMAPIAYWPLNETSGTAAINYGTIGTAGNGAYTGATLAQTPAPGGGLAPSFDGVGDFVNIYSAPLAAAFNGALGSLSIWFKVAAAFWNDVNFKVMFELAADAGNAFDIYKSNAANTLRWIAVGVGGASQVDDGAVSTTAWANVAMTWNKTGNVLKAYLNGAQDGTDQTIPGTFTGNLAATLCTLGCRDSGTPAIPFTGYLAHAAIWNKVLSPAEISSLYSGGL